MKRRSAILLCICLGVASVFQYRLIGSSLMSFFAWCMLLTSHPVLVRGSLLELPQYWLAGIVWISALVYVFVSMFRAEAPTTKGSGAGSSGSQIRTGMPRWSLRIMTLVVFIALTSPFLTPVPPDVQGNLVTTRLLPPLSIGSVTEYLDRESVDRDPEGFLERTFAHASHFLLHRTVLLRTQQAAPQESVFLREYRTIFLFGTDDNARDVFSRVIAGTRVSLGIGIAAALGAMLLGAAIGFSAGMSRGALDGVLMRLTDLFLAIPSLFLVIGALAFVGSSVITIVLVLSLSGWMGIARIVRGEVVTLREREFVLAATLLRVPTGRIILRHLLPNLRSVIIVTTVLQFANAVLGEAALGFLGLGIQPPTATWGNMMGEATGYLSSAWWVGVFPGLFLALVIISAHTMGVDSAKPESRDGPYLR